MGISLSKKRILRTARKRANYTPPFGDPLPDNPLIFFEIAMQHNGRGFLLGKIIVEIKSDQFPTRAATLLQYLDTEVNLGPFPLDRIHPHLLCQARTDHNADLTHNGPGVVSLNLEYLSPQLLFSLGALPWMNQTHFIIGQVVSGYEILKAMELCAAPSGDLLFDISILRCGVGTGDDDDAASEDSGPRGRERRRNIHVQVLKPLLVPIAIGGLLCLFMYPVYCVKKIRAFLHGIRTFIVETSFTLTPNISFP
eukprot:g57.t1